MVQKLLENAPFKMTLKDGTVVEVASFDGGGCMVGESGAYEVHYTPFPLTYDEEYPEYPVAAEVLQRDIESVVDENGETYTDFGNPYFPHHPYGV